MDIKLNMVTREVYSFDVLVENPNEFLRKIRPKEVFQRDLHQFLGKTRTVSINPEYIEWIEIDTLDMPPQAPFMKDLNIRQLSPEAFKHWVNQNKDNLKASMETDVAQNVLLAYGMGSFKSGRTLQFEIRAKMERIEDRIKTSQQIFNMPALFIYGETSGLFLVNTRNIVVWQIVPGLKKSTYFAIPGEMNGVTRDK